MSVINYPKRTGRIIIIFFSILFVIFFIVLFLVLGTTGSGLATNFLIGILILLIILPVIGIIINRIAGPSPKKCPRCNYPVSDYAEYCKNCGFALLGTMAIQAQAPEERDYVIIQEGTKIPEKPNFCPTCGSSLKNVENLRFCEFCGSKIT